MRNKKIAAQSESRKCRWKEIQEFGILSDWSTTVPPPNLIQSPERWRKDFCWGDPHLTLWEERRWDHESVCTGNGWNGNRSIRSIKENTHKIWDMREYYKIYIYNIIYTHYIQDHKLRKWESGAKIYFTKTSCIPLWQSHLYDSPVHVPECPRPPNPK